MGTWNQNKPIKKFMEDHFLMRVHDEQHLPALRSRSGVLTREDNSLREDIARLRRDTSLLQKKIGRFVRIDSRQEFMVWKCGFLCLLCLGSRTSLNTSVGMHFSKLWHD
jgi:hypothetical protein